MTDPPGEDQFVLLNDQPVDETDDDALGMAKAVSKLVGLILGSRGAAPFTLAIDAGWGMGKSSMMLQLQAALNGHRNEGVVTSWFNAWTAQESDALAGLIKSALMGEPEKALRRTLWRVARHRGLLTALHAALVIAASFFHLAGVVDQFWDLLSKDASSRNAGRGDLKKEFSRWAKPTKRRPDGRLLVVFIDDLDRCSSEVIVTVCEAIRLYLALPGVVFIIGCDQNLLIEAARNTSIVSHAPESLRYLEKIIQMTYRKPAPDKAQMIRLAEHWASRSQTTGLVSESIIWPIVIRRTGHNPRRLKTLINSFILEYRLASAGVEVNLLFDKVILQHLYPAFYGVLARPGVQEDTAHDFLEYVDLRRCITDGSELSDAHKRFFKKHSAREPLQNEDPHVALKRLDEVLERVDKGIFSLYSSLAEDPELVEIVTGMCRQPDFAVLLDHMQSNAPAVSPATSLTADPGSFTADPGTDAVAFIAVPGGPVVYEPDKGLSAAATGGDDGAPPDRGPALAGQAPSPTARFEDASTRSWKVFVGSAFGLYGYRQVARDVIEDFTYGGWHCFEPVMMEDYGARPDLARDVSVDAVRDCDILVGILGLRYGAHTPDDQISYTELEFQTATECGLSRLMFLLDELAASRLEGATPEAEDRKDRQARFRSQVAASVVSDANVVSEEDFGQRLTQALEHWVREESFKRDMVDHSEEFKDARRRLLQSRRTGGATLIYGEPGTGKTTLLTALRNDVLVQQAYGRNLIVRIVRLTGAGAVERVRKEVQSRLADLAGQAGVPVADLWPVMILLDLQLDAETGRDVDEETRKAVRRLFTWDTPHAVVLAETSSRGLKESLERELGWAPEAVITVGDYDRVEDALEQMRRDAPSVRSWPEPDTRILAEALGLRPISLFAAAKDIEAEASRSPKRVPTYIRKQLEAIGSETAPAGESKFLARHEVLVRGSIDRLSPQAKDLLALMTVLQPKPAVFPDDIAVALDPGLDLGAAVHAATEEDDGELDAKQLEHRGRAYKLVSELVGRGLLERLRRRGAALGTPEELTLHPANVQVIRDYLPVDDGKRAQANERAEAFYRKRVGETVSGSFDSRSRMEQPDWWDDAEEWIYHLSHLEPGRAGIGYAALFLDAWWWWDLYVKFDFCDQLLDFAERPRVRAVSPQLWEVARLLAAFRDTYPREHEVTVARLHAEIASDPAHAVGLQETARTGAGIIPILKNLCDHLRITELDALFADVPLPESAAEAPSADSTSGEEPGEESDDGKTRLHLLGLICLFVADGHRFRAALEPGGAALAAAEACYRRAESYFQEEQDAWDQAWTRYLLGGVLFQRGEDPEAVWEAAAEAADVDSDTELLANIERARGDHLLAADDLEGALAHYGRAVFYGVALQVTSNLAIGPDAYTKAFYREICLHATKPLVQPLFEESASTADGRLAETKRRLNVMLAEWGDYWKPDERKLDEAFGSADRRIVEQFADTIAAAAFWPAPGEADLGEPESQYCQLVNDLIEKTETQPWVKGLQRWREHLQDK